MPDPDRKSLSATESPALFGASPYLTEWMLYMKFAEGLDIEPDSHSRMDWGSKIQPLVLEQVRDDKKLEVHANEGAHYDRLGYLGCTRDAKIICPDRGPGSLEIKCVFDFRSWATTWDGGRTVPRHYEIQLQQQMYVGDTQGGGYGHLWGLIAVWCCAEMHYFEREPDNELWVQLTTRAQRFFDNVAARREPDPFGSLVELPFMRERWKPIAESTLDRREATDENAHLLERAALYASLDASAKADEKEAEKIKAELLAIAKDRETVWLPHGANFKIKRHGNGRRVVVFIPEGT